jgi:hypothetical protein
MITNVNIVNKKLLNSEWRKIFTYNVKYAHDAKYLYGTFLHTLTTKHRMRGYEKSRDPSGA